MALPKNIDEQLNQAKDWTLREAKVCTIKGALFVGNVRGIYHNKSMGHIGVVVEAMEPMFAGTVHVYPVTQLGEVK